MPCASWPAVVMTILPYGGRVIQLSGVAVGRYFGGGAAECRPRRASRLTACFRPKAEVQSYQFDASKPISSPRVVGRHLEVLLFKRGLPWRGNHSGRGKSRPVTGIPTEI